MSLLTNSLVNKFLKPPIGSFANITFEASSFRVVTYDDYKRETKARYARHELINQTTNLEYLGREPDEISFTMKFTRSTGTVTDIMKLFKGTEGFYVVPEKEVAKVRKLCVEGTADYLILGSDVIGDNMWIIESVSESVDAWDNSGNILFSQIDVRMIEYVARNKNVTDFIF